MTRFCRLVSFLLHVALVTQGLFGLRVRREPQAAVGSQDVHAFRDVLELLHQGHEVQILLALVKGFQCRALALELFDGGGQCGQVRLYRGILGVRQQVRQLPATELVSVSHRFVVPFLNRFEAGVAGLGRPPGIPVSSNRISWTASAAIFWRPGFAASWSAARRGPAPAGGPGTGLRR